MIKYILNEWKQDDDNKKEFFIDFEIEGVIYTINGYYYKLTGEFKIFALIKSNGTIEEAFLPKDLKGSDKELVDTALKFNRTRIIML